MRRIDHALAAALCFALGLVTLVWPGPGRTIVRGTLGDVVVVAFLYFLCGALGWRRGRVPAIFALGAGLELLQWARALPGDPVSVVALGRTFDPWDLIAYASGLCLAVAVERRAAGTVDSRA
jgi:hypothetical protein